MFLDRLMAFFRNKDPHTLTATEAATALLAPVNRELWVVTARADSRAGGLIATFVNSASTVPELPRVVVGVARQHHTWELIEGSGAFALNLLGTEHLPWVWRFGLQSGRDHDKLEGLKTQFGVTGSGWPRGVLTTR